MSSLPFSDCPHCGSARFIRQSGLDSKGRQRFTCKECARTWTAETWDRARSRPQRIQAAIDDFEAGMGIRDAAVKNGIQHSTLTDALRRCLKRRPRCAG